MIILNFIEQKLCIPDGQASQTLKNPQFTAKSSSNSTKEKTKHKKSLYNRKYKQKKYELRKGKNPINQFQGNFHYREPY